MGAAENFDEVVREVSRLVHKLSGIQLNDAQAHMVQSRLRTRMLRLGIKTPEEYLEFLRHNHHQESVALLSLLTTHHTFFFREIAHFEMLENQLLPLILPKVRQRADKTIQVWSAACSRGQEVYSLAMFLDFYLQRYAPDVKYKILGSDVDPESVKIAANGVYLKQELDKAPTAYVGNHWAKGSGDIAHFVRAAKSLRDNCRFAVVNLLGDTGSVATQKFDIIFCRNVFIYFNEAQIKSIVSMLLDHLESDGRLFVGISETLSSLSIPMHSHGYSVYSRQAPKPATKLELVTTPAPTKMATASAIPTTPTAAPVKPLRVLCVDDSKSIQALLAKVLTKENGFEIVGNAYDGQEAAQFLAKNTVDVMTLDIHMPVMDGLTYLQKHFNAKHPPVVIISSVAREDANIALKTLELGAADYVEKPSLNNLLQQAEEIRLKLKMATHHHGKTQAVQLEQQFAKKLVISDQKSKTRVIYCQVSHLQKIKTLMAGWHHSGPGCVILLDAPVNIAASVQQEWSQKLAGTVFKAGERLESVSPGKNAIGLWQEQQLLLTQTAQDVCLVVLGIPTATETPKLIQAKKQHLIVEDMEAHEVPAGFKTLRDQAQDVVPVASMAYMMDLYFSRNG